MKEKESKSNSMVETPASAGTDISFGNSSSDKTKPNNQSVAYLSMDMSKILP
jgi:hypothetical protein